MSIAVDTSIWSLALRRKKSDLNAKEQQLTKILAELIQGNRAQLLGPVRQELLSGLREGSEFARLRDYLSAFPDPSLQTDDYEEASQMSNQCRVRGVAGSAIDFLICAAAHRRNWAIFTTDGDFVHYAKILPIKLQLA